MRLEREPRFAFLTLVLAASIAGSAMAQIVPEGYREGTHIVRAGDTLRGITLAYLGSEELWEQNWDLNPQVEDPDLLFPLQRLRIILTPEVARPTARLTTISGDVEGKPAPSDWNRSFEDDLMLERDGVRANKDSSTVMQFTDGSELTLKDDSTVFLRVAGRTLLGTEERSVEILQGQADLAAVRLPQELDIEIVIGNAVATPMNGESGGVETRARRMDMGGAQVMVFEGLGEVESAGQTVTLEEGMGTAVPEDGPPAPPEKLLPPVEGLMPGTGEQYELERSRFSWSPVAEAASYTLEICRDAGCGNLVRRETDLPGNEWEIDELPLGDYLWRVTAVSQTGLDGYASEAQAIGILANRGDDDPPVGEFIVTGRSVVSDGVTYYAGDLDIRLEVEDKVTGVDSIVLEVDGHEVQAESLQGSWESGDYEVAATVIDGSGNSATFGPLEIHVDADPPAIDWVVGGEEILAGHAGASGVPSDWAKVSGKWSRRELKDFGRGRAEPKWTVLAWSSVKPNVAGRFTPEAVSSQRSHEWFALRRRDARVAVFAPALAVEGAADRLADGLLSVESTDDRSGQEEFKIWRRPGPDDRYWLEVEATDRLGNRNAIRWPFPPAD